MSPICQMTKLRLAGGHTASKWHSWDLNSVPLGLFCSPAQARSGGEAGMGSAAGEQAPYPPITTPPPRPQRQQVKKNSAAGSINNLGPWALPVV